MQWNIFLFPKLKLTLRRTRYDSIEDIKVTPTKELEAILKKPYEKCYGDLFKRWHMCEASNEKYFERDKINFEWPLCVSILKAILL